MHQHTEPVLLLCPPEIVRIDKSSARNMKNCFPLKIQTEYLIWGQGQFIPIIV